MTVAAASVKTANTVVITAECRGCGACLLTCPEHAIRPVPAHGASAHGAPAHGAPAHGALAHSASAHGASAEAGPAHLVVLDKLCTRCGECIEVCPADAVILTPVTPR